MEDCGQASDKEGLKVWNILELRKKILKRSTFAVPFPTIKIFKYHQRRLADRFDEGLVFLKSVERGKCFIEYIPAECAWNPIEAPGYMYINCLWVSGSFKGHGYSSDLLSKCIEDSREKGKEGLCILAAARKKPFLADSKFPSYK